MGCLFAVRLALCGIKVHLVDHRPERLRRLEESGLVVETEAGELRAGNVQLCLHAPSHVDLAIVLVKAYSTASLRLPPQAPVLTLQNGLGNAETLCAMAGSARVLAGTTTEAATMVAPGRIRYAASGTTLLGSWTACPVTEAAELLSAAGFHTEITDSPGQALWEKVAISAGINPLTALLNVSNGHLVEVQETRQLLRDLVVEAAKTAASEGYRFNYSLVERAQEVCRDTATNISSMLQDIRAGRQTEIDAISGEILRRAALASLPAPRTRVIYQLLRGLESR